MHVLFQLFSTITILTPNVIAIIHLRNAATESEFNILNERYLQALVERPLITVILRYIYIYIYSHSGISTGRQSLILITSRQKINQLSMRITNDRHQS